MPPPEERFVQELLNEGASGACIARRQLAQCGGAATKVIAAGVLECGREAAAFLWI